MIHEDLCFAAKFMGAFMLFVFCAIVFVGLTANAIVCAVSGDMNAAMWSALAALGALGCALGALNALLWVVTP